MDDLRVEMIANSFCEDLMSDDEATYELDNGRIIRIYRLHYGIPSQRYFRLELLCNVDEWNIYRSKTLDEILYSFAIGSLYENGLEEAISLLLTMDKNIKILERIENYGD